MTTNRNLEDGEQLEGSQWICAAIDVEDTPSRSDGVAKQDEIMQRLKGCMLIHHIGVSMNRYFYLILASKIL